MGAVWKKIYSVSKNEALTAHVLWILCKVIVWVAGIQVSKVSGQTNLSLLQHS